MRKYFLLFMLVSLGLFAAATEPDNDTTYWKSKYESAIGFSQTALYNLAKGGEKTSFSSNIPVLHASLIIVYSPLT